MNNDNNNSDNTAVFEDSQLQSTFNRIATHLLTQKAKAIAYGNCKYHDHKGLKCAVGCLISDEAYDPHLEGMNIGEFALIKALECSGITVTYRMQYLLSDCQTIHDGWYVDDWHDRLTMVAIKYNLTMPSLNETL